MEGFSCVVKVWLTGLGFQLRVGHMSSVHEALGLILSVVRTPNQNETLQVPFKAVNKKLTHLKRFDCWRGPEKVSRLMISQCGKDELLKCAHRKTLT